MTNEAAREMIFVVDADRIARHLGAGSVKLRSAGNSDTHNNRFRTDCEPIKIRFLKRYDMSLYFYATRVFVSDSWATVCDSMRGVGVFRMVD